MIRPRVGFIVFGVHKDGLEDPSGRPFIDEEIVARSKEVLKEKGNRFSGIPYSSCYKRRGQDCLKRNEAPRGCRLCHSFSGTLGLGC